MASLKPIKSMEDLRRAPADVGNSAERRARSSSPVKHRRSAPPGTLRNNFPSSPQALVEELSRIALGSPDLTGVSLQKLKKLSQSPLSKKLHIDLKGSSSPYPIPIPFTLQLPPKLSPTSQKPRSRSASPSSRSKSRSPTRQSRLVYTGNGYEKIDSSASSDEDASEYEKHLKARISFTAKPQKNSPTRKAPSIAIAPGAKSASKNLLALSDSTEDGLSIIEEASNSAETSRQSTLKKKDFDEKSLPTPPTATDSEDVSFDLDSSFASAMPRSLHIENNVREHVTCAPRAASSKGKLMNMNSFKSAQSTAQSIRLAPESHQRNSAYLVGSQSEPFLRISKRSFSDESHVSSISSMTTVNDMMSFSTKRFNLLSVGERKGSQNSTSGSESTLSDCSSSSVTDSLGSWESLQKSVDLSIHDSISSGAYLRQSPTEAAHPIENTPSLVKVQPPYPVEEPVSEVSTIQSDLGESDVDENREDITVTSGDDIADVYLEDTTEMEPDESSPSREVSINDENHRASEEDSTLEEETRSFETIDSKNLTSTRKADIDNKGLGQSFSFPNDDSNITNGESVKQRVKSSETFKSDAFSYYSTVDGQIEIPELSEASFATAKVALAVNGTRFDDLVTENETDDEVLEPIGVPSKKSKRIMTEQFNSMFSDSDTDIESGKFTLYSHHVKAKSTSHLSGLKEKTLPPLPSEEQALSLKSGSHKRGHSRHKSLGNIDFNISEFRNDTVPKTRNALVTNTAKRVESKPEVMHLEVADPPTKINYAVDFKEADGHNEITRSLTPTVTEMLSHTSEKRHSKVSKAGSSSSHSTYQSSRSALLSASTDASDTGSVIIDLTRDKYDVCMVARNNSTMSYRSVTEKFQGKQVEVVLVDDENDKDLESIYSKYRNNWLDRRQSTLSATSCASSNASSAFSYGSVSSSKQIAVKETSRSKLIGRVNSKPNSSSGSVSSMYRSTRIKVPKAIQEERNQKEKYFDYTRSDDHYDFNSFITQERSK